MAETSSTAAPPPPPASSPNTTDPALEELSAAVLAVGRREAARRLAQHDDATIVAVLQMINTAVAQEVLDAFAPEDRQHVFAAAPPAVAAQWMKNQQYPEGSIGRMMSAPIGTFRAQTTIAEAIDQLRELVRKAFITYLFVVDEEDKLIGVVVMREMLLADPSMTLEQVMIRNPFSLEPKTPLMQAMKQVLNKHFPVYPVCENGELVGLVRGQTMFEKQAIEISAQAGSMVGVDKEERLATPWPRSLKLRHPWLQLNLLTAFIAAAVVGVFQNTIDQLVVLAVFLPVLAGQSGNTGCQALAVALRAMTLGELKEGRGRAAVTKEALLGLLNGALVGLTAGLGMFFVATVQSDPQVSAPAPILLAGVVFIAMVGACLVSGISGVVIPLALKKLGADPATASSIFLTTATDVASMGMFLGLATLLI